MATQSQILSKLKSLGTLLGKDKGEGAGPYTNLAILCHKNAKATVSAFRNVAESLGLEEDKYGGDGEVGGITFVDDKYDLLLCFYPYIDSNYQYSYTVVLASLMEKDY